MTRRIAVLTAGVVLLVLFGVSAIVSELVRGVWLADGDFLRTLVTFGRVSIPCAIYTTLIVPAGSWVLARIVGSKTWVLHAS